MIVFRYLIAGVISGVRLCFCAIDCDPRWPHIETFEKCSTSFKFKEDEIFNLEDILLFRGLKFESDNEIGRKKAFCEGLTLKGVWRQDYVECQRHYDNRGHNR